MARVSGRIRTLGLASALVVAAAGCGGVGDIGGGGGGGGEGGGGGITFLHWRGEDVQVFNDIIDRFTEETGIAVEQQALPSDAYVGQAQATLLSGEGSDVFATFPGAQFAELSGTDLYEDLTNAEFTGNYDPQFIDQGRKDGRQLALPYQLVFNIPVYNVGLFEEHGLEPPPDWDGFLAACDTLKSAGVAPIIFAGDVSPSQFINPLLMNNQPSEDIWRQVEANEAKVTEDWFVKTLTQLRQLVDRDCFNRDPLGTSGEGASALFAQEKGAMLATGSYSMAVVAAQNPDIRQGLLAPITTSAGEATYEGIYTTTFMLGVNTNGNTEQAMQFLEYLSRPEVAAEYANGTGQLLTLTDVEYETEELRAQTEWVDKKLLFQPRFTITNPDSQTALQTAVTDVMSGMAPEQAAQKLQETFDRNRDA